jgi:hypothetical protein
MTLQGGDVLLYRPKGVYGWLIRIHTGHPIAHVEIAMGPGQSAASRDGVGVGYYPTRTDGLMAVMRPRGLFDLTAARGYVNSMVGTPYGWADLLNFVSLSIDTKGIVCSPFVTNVLRAGGVPVFNAEPANNVAPFQFMDSELLVDVTKAVGV